MGGGIKILRGLSGGVTFDLRRQPGLPGPLPSRVELWVFQSCGRRMPFRHLHWPVSEAELRVAHHPSLVGLAMPC